ncbi:MAG: ExeA family protein [Vicinamibacterales bacterium]
MYEGFYGLRQRPFDLLPDPRFLFLPARQREAFSNLRYGLTVPKGLTLLLGEAGTGKTTLVRAALSDLDEQGIACALVSNPTLRRDEFFEVLTEGFGLSPSAASSKTRFLNELRAFLTERHEAGGITAIVLDEAQSLPYELLEEVRLLSNIETTSSKLLNVVLAGQPELADRLNEPGLRQLKQRIALRCELKPFDRSETAAYIAGRLRIAGGDPGTTFSREAVLAIHAASNGVPRTVNVICDNALIGGFAAQLRPVPVSIVAEVCADFDLALPVSRQHGATWSASPAESASPDARAETAAGAPERSASAPPARRRGSLFGLWNRRPLSTRSSVP